MARMLWMMMVLFLLGTGPAQTLVSAGVYAPAPASQKNSDGSKNTFTLKPMVALDAVWNLSGRNFFMPELGYVYHGEGIDGYKKHTTFLLLDLGYLLTGRFLLRYGLGTFLTSISGDGGAVVLNNGSGTATFYRPGETSTSYNTAMDLGAELGITKNFALQLETYLMEILSKDKRSVTYSLGLNYYL